MLAVAIVLSCMMTSCQVGKGLNKYVIHDPHHQSFILSDVLDDDGDNDMGYETDSADEDKHSHKHTGKRGRKPGRAH